LNAKNKRNPFFLGLELLIHIKFVSLKSFSECSDN